MSVNSHNKLTRWVYIPLTCGRCRNISCKKSMEQRPTKEHFIEVRMLWCSAGKMIGVFGFLQMRLSLASQSLPKTLWFQAESLCVALRIGAYAHCHFDLDAFAFMRLTAKQDAFACCLPLKSKADIVRFRALMLNHINRCHFISRLMACFRIRVPISLS